VGMGHGGVGRWWERGGRGGVGVGFGLKAQAVFASAGLDSIKRRLARSLVKCSPV